MWICEVDTIPLTAKTPKWLKKTKKVLKLRYLPATSDFRRCYPLSPNEAQTYQYVGKQVTDSELLLYR